MPSGVRLVVDREFLPITRQLIGAATATVDLMAFSFAISRVAGTSNAAAKIMRELLERKSKLGEQLRVRVYLEGRRETSTQNHRTATLLTRAGISVKFGSTHAKGILIDGRYLLFGSTNLTHQSVAKNNETNLLFEDSAVSREFRRYFEHFWRGGTHGTVKLKLPLLADGAFKPVLLKLINQAQSDLEFSIYFFDQLDVEAALLRAHARGVRITGFVHDHRSFALDYVRRTRRTLARLRRAGIRRLYLAPPTLFTHSKYLIQDHRTLLLGTANWLDQDVTTHPQLCACLKHEALSQGLSAHLAAQIKAQGQPLRR